MSRTCQTKNCKNRCCKYPSGSWKENCNECFKKTDKFKMWKEKQNFHNWINNNNLDLNTGITPNIGTESDLDSLESLEIGQQVDNTVLSTQIQNLQNTILELQNTVLEFKRTTANSLRVMNHDMTRYIFNYNHLHKK
jgi:hypothetical protein